MITTSEIYRVANMLDEEYELEIKPILHKAQDSIDIILSIIQTKDFITKEKRLQMLNIGYHLPNDMKYLLNNFQYNFNNRGVDKDRIKATTFGFMGYSDEIYDNLVDFLTNKYCSKDTAENEINMINFLTDMKKKFNYIKSMYNKFFVVNNGEMCKSFASIVEKHYNTIMIKDEEEDNKFYALFDKPKTAKTIHINILIEET